MGTIALLFTDIEGSTQLARRVGTGWPEVLSEHHRLVGSAIEAEHGWVDGTEGDAFFATFNDPASAARAAVSALRAVRDHAWPPEVGELKVRMGLHVGYVERNALGYVGLEVHRAARIASAAHGGQLLLSATAQSLIAEVLMAESLGSHRLKDFPQPEHLYCAVVDGRGASAFPPPRVQTARPNNLPAGATVLVGRDDELAHIIGALDAERERLVTLTGRSGAGKTTLALAAARQLLDSFPGGVWLVDLAPLNDPGDVVPAIAAAVGARGDVQSSAGEAVVARLRDRGQTLLLLDNVEHVLDAAQELAALLDSLPDVQVLATSQAPLRLSEELCFPLDSLADEAALALIQRVARRRNPGIRIDEGTRATLLEVVHVLDGLPLALELAAARLALLNPQQLLDRLGSSPDMLRDDRSDRPDRHRSLRATVDWSLNLLDPGARRLFTRLGVFAGPVEMDDVEAICGTDDLDVLDALFRLLEVALVRRVESGDGRIRFGLPEGLRQIAAQLLDADPEAAHWRRRHALHQHQIVWPARFIWVTRERYKAVVDATPERRTALAWAKSVDDPIYGEMAAAHALIAADRGHLRDVLDTIEPLLTEANTPAELRCLQLIALSWADIGLERSDEALAAAEEAVEVAPDPQTLSFALTIRGTVHCMAHRPAAGVRDCDEGLALAREVGDDAFLTGSLMLASQAHMFNRDTERFEALLEEAQQAALRSDADFIWRIHTELGDREVLNGRPAAALEHYARSLEEGEARAHDLQILFDLVGTAVALAALGEDELALEVSGMASAQTREMGGVGHAATHMLGGGDLKEARQRIGVHAVAEHEERGRAVPAASRVSRTCEVARQVARAAAAQTDVG